MQTLVETNQASNAALWIGRVMSGLVIAFMLLDGAVKLVPLDVVVTTSEQMGIPGSLARTLGILGLISTLLYAIPRTSIIGAILLTGYLGGAIASHLRLGDPIFTHTLFGLYLGLLVWGGLYLRDDRLRALIPWRANQPRTNPKPAIPIE
jgi:DoxX-like family